MDWSVDRKGQPRDQPWSDRRIDNESIRQSYKSTRAIRPWISHLAIRVGRETITHHHRTINGWSWIDLVQSCIGYKWPWIDPVRPCFNHMIAYQSRVDHGSVMLDHGSIANRPWIIYDGSWIGHRSVADWFNKPHHSATSQPLVTILSSVSGIPNLQLRQWATMFRLGYVLIRA